MDRVAPRANTSDVATRDAWGRDVGAHPPSRATPGNITEALDG
jgi:hypothetical protein